MNPSCATFMTFPRIKSNRSARGPCDARGRSPGRWLWSIGQPRRPIGHCGRADGAASRAARWVATIQTANAASMAAPVKAQVAGAARSVASP